MKVICYYYFSTIKSYTGYRRFYTHFKSSSLSSIAIAELTSECSKKRHRAEAIRSWSLISHCSLNSCSFTSNTATLLSPLTIISEVSDISSSSSLTSIPASTPPPLLNDADSPPIKTFPSENEWYCLIAVTVIYFSTTAIAIFDNYIERHLGTVIPLTIFHCFQLDHLNRVCLS